MIANVTEVKRSEILEIDGDPWQITEIVSQTPSARGASMIVKAKLRNLRTGQGLSKTWRGGDMVTVAEVERRAVQFLYRQGDEFAFMDTESYDQFSLDTAQVGEAGSYLLENAELRAVSFGGRIIALDLPMTVDMEVTETAPAIKGATAQAQLKPATVETGLQVMVPSYIETGERIRVDTRDGRFVERAK
jgi:elongation factor P